MTVTHGRAGTGPRTARVVVASNRAAAGVYADETGPLIVSFLTDLGFDVPDPLVVPDGEPVRDALAEAVAAGVHVVLTTGGTGLTPTDRTPEMTRPLLDREVPGITEAIRAYGNAKVPTAALSRGLAGIAGDTLVVNLPGSRGGVKDGLAVLSPLLAHAVDQVAGGDHGRSAGGDHGRSAGGDHGRSAGGDHGRSAGGGHGESAESRPEGSTAGHTPDGHEPGAAGDHDRSAADRAPSTPGDSPDDAGRAHHPADHHPHGPHQPDGADHVRHQESP